MEDVPEQYDAGILRYAPNEGEKRNVEEFVPRAQEVFAAVALIEAVLWRLVGSSRYCKSRDQLLDQVLCRVLRETCLC